MNSSMRKSLQELDRLLEQLHTAIETTKQTSKELQETMGCDDERPEP